MLRFTENEVYVFDIDNDDATISTKNYDKTDKKIDDVDEDIFICGNFTLHTLGLEMACVVFMKACCDLVKMRVNDDKKIYNVYLIDGDIGDRMANPSNYRFSFVNEDGITDFQIQTTLNYDDVVDCFQHRLYFRELYVSQNFRQRGQIARCMKFNDGAVKLLGEMTVRKDFNNSLDGFTKDCSFVYWDAFSSYFSDTLWDVLVNEDSIYNTV